MTYGIKIFKNGKKQGCLTFSTGKKIVLNNKEVQELEAKIDYWQRATGEALRHQELKREVVAKLPRGKNFVKEFEWPKKEGG
jgi:predicted Holliday junction resolvase-like endonuclease